MTRPIVITGLNLSDGQKVLLMTPEYLDAEDSDAISEKMHELFPGVQFFILSGGFQALTFSKDVDMVIGEVE